MSKEEQIKQSQKEEVELKFPEEFYKYDKEDMKSVIQGFPNQIRQAYKLGDDLNLEGNIDQIIIAGMGGSAIAGDLLKAYLSDVKIPITVCRDYELPSTADKESLVIISSYSGNTEETISAYKDALRKFCKIICITSGGRIQEIATSNRTPIVKIPKGIQPRAALAYSFFPMLKLMETFRIVESKKAEVERVVKTLDKQVFMNTGLAIAEKLVDKTILVYASEKFRPVAYRWKTQLNENSKTMAFANTFSEMNHNEISGFANMNAKYHCIILRNDEDNHRIKKRMDITKKHLKNKSVDVTDINITGDTYLTKIFSAIYVGDWTSYFLALKYMIDPTPVKDIENFKKELGSFI